MEVVTTAVETTFTDEPTETLNPEENKKLYLQKFGIETIENIMIGFRKKAASLVSDNEELSTKISKKEKGYGASNQDRIAIEYNQYYLETRPDEYPQYFMTLEEK